MFRAIALIPSFLSIVVIVSVAICKYFNSSKILLVVIILASIFYQIDTNKINNKNYNFEETLINVSKFIIITGGLGYIVAKIVGLFLSGFN